MQVLSYCIGKFPFQLGLRSLYVSFPTWTYDRIFPLWLVCMGVYYQCCGLWVNGVGPPTPNIGDVEVQTAAVPVSVSLPGQREGPGNEPPNICVLIHICV